MTADKPNALDNPSSRLSVRTATDADIRAIADLSARVYKGTGISGCWPAWPAT